VHYYEFNIPAWVLHTSHLTLEEECVYRRLLDYYYDTEKPIPEETKQVIRRLRLVNYESIVVQILGEFFHLEADGWHNNRADIVISEYQSKADKARENGKKGGRPKQNKAPETQPVILANPEETGSKANYELLTINNELETNLKDPAPQADADLITGLDDSTTDKQKKATPANFKPESLADEMPSPLRDWWLKWVNYRRARKLSTKEPTWRAQAANLAEWGKAGHDPCLAIKASIENGWQGLFEPKPKTNGVNHGNQPKSPIERFMRKHYPNAGPGPENDHGPMGRDDGPVRGAMDPQLRGDTGRIGPVDQDLIGDFSRTDS